MPQTEYSKTAPLEELLYALSHSKIRPPALALERLMTTGEAISFRRHFTIQDCGEKLVPIAGPGLSLQQPNPHQAIGAPYGGYSPFSVREGVLQRLICAAKLLDGERPGCRLQIYDAYRPLAVQSFMVDFEFKKLAKERGIDPASVDVSTQEKLMLEVLMVWSKPDNDPLCPPPHSTGAAIDLTIIDDRGKPLDMGGAIDQIGKVSLPNHFADFPSDSKEANYHANRELLHRAMSQAGFRRLPHEWWHFSYGDQMWALLEWLNNPLTKNYAIYGRIE